MTCDWELTVKMSYFKKNLEVNRPLFENICYSMADMIGGFVDNLDLDAGMCIFTAEAKIQTDLETWWDSIFSEHSDLENSIGIEARGEGLIIWRYKNGKCTYCSNGSTVLVDAANGIFPPSDEE